MLSIASDCQLFIAVTDRQKFGGSGRGLVVRVLESGL